MNKNRTDGFTLVELLIVIAIVAIIAAIAIPSYQESVRSAKRTDGQSALMSIMQAQERFFAENMSYSADLTDLGYATVGGVASEEGFYAVSSAACAGSTIANCVILTATGDDSTGNEVLTLNSLGQKTGNW